MFYRLLLSVFLAIIFVNAAHAQPAVISPEEWSRRLLERCLEERQQDELLLSQLPARSECERDGHRRSRVSRKGRSRPLQNVEQRTKAVLRQVELFSDG